MLYMSSLVANGILVVPKADLF